MSKERFLRAIHSLGPSVSSPVPLCMCSFVSLFDSVCLPLSLLPVSMSLYVSLYVFVSSLSVSLLSLSICLSLPSSVPFCLSLCVCRSPSLPSLMLFCLFSFLVSLGVSLSPFLCPRRVAVVLQGFMVCVP